MGARIAIVGTGAVGGYVGAHMAQAGEDVTLVDFWPENVETIRTTGLRISHLRDVQEFTTAARALHVTELQRLSKEMPIDRLYLHEVLRHGLGDDDDQAVPRTKRLRCLPAKLYE